MRNPERHLVDLVTDANGDAIGYTPDVNGGVCSIRYIKDDFENTLDFVVSSEKSEQVLWEGHNITATQRRNPRCTMHLDTGGIPMGAEIVLCREKIKIVVSKGGDSKKGSFEITMC